jgi:hypothetical protein
MRAESDCVHFLPLKAEKAGKNNLLNLKAMEKIIIRLDSS